MSASNDFVDAIKKRQGELQAGAFAGRPTPERYLEVFWQNAGLEEALNIYLNIKKGGVKDGD